MTTNIDRAAEVIGRYVHPDFAEDAAQALAAAGLIAPDPEKPQRYGDLPIWLGNDPVLTVTAHSILGVSLISETNEQGTGPAEINLTIEGARTVAHALLSAADYAEEHTNDQ